MGEAGMILHAVNHIYSLYKFTVYLLTKVMRWNIRATLRKNSIKDFENKVVNLRLISNFVYDCVLVHLRLYSPTLHLF